MATYVMTGATGQVGRCLVPSLVERGHQLILIVRPKDGRNPRSRVEQVFGTDVASRCLCWPGEMLEQAVSVPLPMIRPWRGQINGLIHCAGSIKFDENLAEQTRRANLDGTRHALELAKRLRSPFFFMSTAYVAGSANELHEDDVPDPKNARNPYERSKIEAEQLVGSWDGPWAIWRPGVVVGDSRTGETAAFSGYYGFFLYFWVILNNTVQRWEADKAWFLQEGIRLAGGCLELPLHLQCSSTSTLNLIPSDWLVKVTLRLLDRGAHGETFHLVHPSPPPVRWVIQHSLHRMGINGIVYHDEPFVVDMSDKPELARMQSMLDRGVARYDCYKSHEAKFGDEKLREVLGGARVPPPAVDEEFLNRMVDYAVRQNFGVVLLHERRVHG